MCAVAAVAVVLAVSACNKKGEIFEQQMDTIRSWVESRNENGSAYTEIMSGCSATSSIRRMAGELRSRSEATVSI